MFFHAKSFYYELSTSQNSSHFTGGNSQWTSREEGLNSREFLVSFGKLQTSFVYSPMIPHHVNENSCSWGLFSFKTHATMVLRKNMSIEIENSFKSKQKAAVKFLNFFLFSRTLVYSLNSCFPQFDLITTEDLFSGKWKQERKAEISS